jgi:cytochrome c oxidase assembly factor CtaG
MPVTAFVLAHGGPHGLGAAALGEWVWEPVTILLLIASAALYARGVRNIWKSAGTGGGIRRWEAGAFLLGTVLLAAALLSPLAWLSTVLFSAHMTQHEILMLVAAPLLVFGRPMLAFLWALSPASRESTARVIRRPGFARSWHAMTGPFAVFVLHGLALWVWHLPALYDAALGHQGIHAVQHVCFVATASLFWWGMVNGRYGRIGYGVGVLYVFLTALHSSLLGALMTIAPVPWYSGHVAAARRWQIDPLADQQLAGLVMWIPSGVIFIVFGLALLAAWLGESERRARLGSVS